nr:uncharacterized protein LOC117281234 [Nicotiana tomentosiformis]
MVLFVPMKTIEEPAVSVPKTRKEYNDADIKAIEKNFRAKKIFKKKKKKDNERREPKRDKHLVLKIDKNDSSGEDADMAYLTKRFQKMVRRNEGIPKRGSSSKPRGYDLCHKCGKPGHFIKDYPLLKKDQYKHNTNKAAKRNLVPHKRFKRKDVADNIVKQDLAAWVDSSSKSGEDDEHGDSSMMATESEAAEYDAIFALIVKSDNDGDESSDTIVAMYTSNGGNKQGVGFRKSSKKPAVQNSGKESSVKVMEVSNVKVGESGEKKWLRGLKPTEKAKSVRKSMERKVGANEGLGSSKMTKVRVAMNEERENMRNQKVLWGRTFAPDIIDMSGMRQLVDICDFQQWTPLFTNESPKVYEAEVRSCYAEFFSVEDDNIYMKVNGVDFVLDEAVLGTILGVPTEGISSTKGTFSSNFRNTILKDDAVQ